MTGFEATPTQGGGGGGGRQWCLTLDLYLRSLTQQRKARVTHTHAAATTEQARLQQAAGRQQPYSFAAGILAFVLPTRHPPVSTAGE